MGRKFIGKDYHSGHPSPQLQGQPQPLIRREATPFLIRGSFNPWSRYLEKDAAWNHVLGRSEADASETTRKYEEAIRSVEKQARDLYDPEHKIYDILTTDLDSAQFIRIMIWYGCSTLQLALFVLGGSKQHACFPTTSIFVEGRENDVYPALLSMFKVGNQIPLVVLKELMKQSFFISILNQGKWQELIELEKRVFFELLVVPAFNARGATSTTISTVPKRDKSVKSSILKRAKSLYSFNRRGPSQEPHHLLHGLWLLMTTGQANKGAKDDMEVGNKNGGCYGLWLLIKGQANKGSKDDNEVEDVENGCNDVFAPAVRSATELKEVGIFFKDNEGRGSRGIRFKKNMINAVLFLPRIAINYNTISLFEMLMSYEVAQGLGESERKVCAYVQLMRELIRSPEDARLLAIHGIILADPTEEKQLPKLLEGLDIPQSKNDPNLYQVRYQISNYVQPSKFKNLRDILSIVLFLTLLQTIYTILGYHKQH